MAEYVTMDRRSSSGSWIVVLIVILSLGALAPRAAAADETHYVTSVDDSGQQIYLDDARKPALFTRDFGDCMGSSAVNVTRFDAAYYKDNMTVVFHLRGSTSIRNESLMMDIGVYAYGESRFDLTFNPCNANINSLCPIKAKVPVRANGIIPVAQSDVANIPDIALTIPDFEGQAILRIFANSTQTQIGCYSAVVTNGVTFAHASAVGPVLAVFTLMAIIASFVTAVYGEDVATIRTHYAHSLSVAVVFAVWHHIFLTGALSLHWPSVLPAFWSNFAWAAGMIDSGSMQRSIDALLGSRQGNASMVGAAAVLGTAWFDDQSFFSPDVIYKEGGHKVSTRSILDSSIGLPSRGRLGLAKRGVDSNATDGFTWYGKPVRQGLPLPGNYYGFPATLAQANIAMSNAFMTAFLWLLIAVVCVVGAIVILKSTLELLSMTGLVAKDRLTLFRRRWTRITIMAASRTLLIAFFLIMLLTFFQFAYKGSGGVLAIASIVFGVVFGIMTAVGIYACYSQLRSGRYIFKPTRLHLGKTTCMGRIPWATLSLHGQDEEPPHSWYSIPWQRIEFLHPDPHRAAVHQDPEYVLRFGWLTARFRRTRWWFFALWISYEFVRACFYGGAVRWPKVQVFGLLLVELIALVVTVRLRPFEGARLNALLVYLLGFSKVATLALSAAFDPRFNLPRIKTTVIGVVIIVIQGILTIVLLIAIVVSAVTSYFSVTRNRQQCKPRSWAPVRARYFKHLEKAAEDRPSSPPVPTDATTELASPYFKVTSVRRYPTIDDEAVGWAAPINESCTAPNSAHGSRRNSMREHGATSHSSLPFGARVHRASWSTRDFESLRAANASASSTRMSTYTGMLGSDVALRTEHNPSPSPSRIATALANRQDDAERDVISTL